MESVLLCALTAASACGAPAVERVTARQPEPAVAEAHTTTAPRQPEPPALHEIALPGDGRVFTHALAEVDDGIALIATTPDGLVRASVDPESRTVEVSAPLAVDRFPHLAAYERARDMFWWVAAGAQEHLPPQGREHAARTLTRSIVVGDGSGLRGEIDRCPPRTPPPLPRARRRRGGSAGSGALAGLGTGAGLAIGDCNHEVFALLPVANGLLVGGSLATGAPLAPRPWLGLVSREGALVTEVAFDAANVDGRVAALAATEAGVFVLLASTLGGVAHVTVVTLREGSLERVASTTLETASHAPRPRFAMVPAPGGGVFVLVPRVTDLLVLAEVARDGSIVREQPISGVPLTMLATTDLWMRGGAPWLSIVDSRGGREQHLVLARVDPITGAAIDPRELVLPSRFYPESALATEDGFVLAGRVDLARPIVAWIPSAP